MRRWARRTGTAALAVAVAAAGAAPAGAQVMDEHVYTYVAFDKLEYGHGFDERPVEFDGQAWIGGDFDKLWVKARGEHSTLETEGEFQGEALYSRMWRPFWNLQGGVRLDRRYGGEAATRGLLAFGLEGLAPYWFEVEAFGYVSQDGDFSARLEASYELLFTQRLVLEPEVEVDLALQDVEAFGVASGLDELELAARLRYEIVRELAPYVGIAWVRKGLPNGVGAGTSSSFVAGLRWWY